ncbi:hypothetical protein Kpol_1068p5, partial [Vanderwaltozyma polyspora DSM 70294]
MLHQLLRASKHQFATSAEIANTMGGGAGNRTVYIGNINPRSKAEDICNVVRGGTLQQIKFFKEKGICFVTFIEAASAAQFYANSFIDPIILHNNTLRVGWGDHSGPLPKSISLAVTVGASRNVYVSLPEYAFKDKFINDPEYKEYHNKYVLPTEEELRKDFSYFGEMEQVNFLNDGHCCWINFMNIRSAIKLVESVNSSNGGKTFHERYANRYKGLIIGYGKDRCGNVNKSLISGKNSKFYRKVKKPSYNIRLQQLEEERKQEEKNKISNKSINLNSFGIQVETPSQNESEQEEPKISLDGLGMSLSKPNSENHDLKETDDSDSDISTDIELIIDPPVRENTKGNKNKKQNHRKNDMNNNLNFGNPPPVSKTLLESSPPLAPATLSRDFQKSSKQLSSDLTNLSTMDQNDMSENDSNTSSKNASHKRSSKKNKKLLPGSDVMSQYLAQLQHSTFMYAANILGASSDEPEFYDENVINAGNS